MLTLRYIEFEVSVNSVISIFLVIASRPKEGAATE